jgi:Lrp/AsnC family transcriptional regulator, leucine-responsive regulatory protein
MKKIDKKDCIILNMLQENCRASLTEIAKKVELSVDSVKKRIDKLTELDYFDPCIQIKPRRFGFNNIVDIKVKLSSHSKKDTDRFLKYLISHPRIAEVFTVSGEWDFSIVVLSKDAHDLGHFNDELHKKFGTIIREQSESTTLIAYKFEKYDMIKLLGFND